MYCGARLAFIAGMRRLSVIGSLLAAAPAAAGTTIRSSWCYLETDPPMLLSEASVTVERPDHWGQFNFRLAPGRQWRIGGYRIELRVGDELMAEATFRVLGELRTLSHVPIRRRVLAGNVADELSRFAV